MEGITRERGHIVACKPVERPREELPSLVLTAQPPRATRRIEQTHPNDVVPLVNSPLSVEVKGKTE
jgi:hypothetical protein